MANARSVSSAFTKAFAMLLVCWPLVSCSDLMEGKPYAEQGVVKFHEQFNSRKFSEIYDASHDDFKKAASKAKFIEFTSAVHRKLGAVVSTNNAGWQVNNYNLTTYVVLQQATQFRDGRGDEVFTFVIKDKKAWLVGYNINSSDLIIR